MPSPPTSVPLMTGSGSTVMASAADQSSSTVPKQVVDTALSLIGGSKPSTGKSQIWWLVAEFGGEPEPGIKIFNYLFLSSDQFLDDLPEPEPSGELISGGDFDSLSVEPFGEPLNSLLNTSLDIALSLGELAFGEEFPPFLSLLLLL